jgi:hypothetical protein
MLCPYEETAEAARLKAAAFRLPLKLTPEIKWGAGFKKSSCTPLMPDDSTA